MDDDDNEYFLCVDIETKAKGCRTTNNLMHSKISFYLSTSLFSSLQGSVVPQKQTTSEIVSSNISVAVVGQNNNNKNNQTNNENKLNVILE